jgi:hypothetical protein
MIFGMEKCREEPQTADCRCEAGRGRLQKCKMRSSRAGGLRGALEAFLVGLVVAQQKTKDKRAVAGYGRSQRGEEGGSPRGGGDAHHLQPSELSSVSTEHRAVLRLWTFSQSRHSTHYSWPKREAKRN